jgi:hypothetical protein
VVGSGNDERTHTIKRILNDLLIIERIDFSALPLRALRLCGAYSELLQNRRDAEYAENAQRYF